MALVVALAAVEDVVGGLGLGGLAIPLCPVMVRSDGNVPLSEQVAY
jgi:hypothetical protein